MKEIRWLAFAISGVLLLGACSEEKPAKTREEKQLHVAPLIRLSHYFSDLEEEISFPVWFNDSLIRENAIRTLTRKIYALNQDSARIESLKTIKKYGFTKEGFISTYEIIQFYENMEVSHISFTYPKEIDEFGFSPVETSLSQEEISRSRFKTVSKEEYTSDFLVYSSQVDGTFLMCMLNEKLHGPLSVDSVFHPTSFDFILLGSPVNFRKKYHVENKVNERNVTEVSFDPKKEYVKEVRFEKTPFFYHRTVNYDASGTCRGFVDSTFSIDRFISARVSFWELDKQKKPVRMVHKTNASNNELQNTQIETFEYDYYE